MGQKVSLPDAPPPASGAGAEAPKSPTGGQLFKFEGEAYALFHPNVTPELFDDGDDESPQWILDVRAFASFRSASRGRPEARRRVSSSRGSAAPRAFESVPRRPRRAASDARDLDIFVPLFFIVGTHDARFRFLSRAKRSRPSFFPTSV
jgi:hypothetical protein